MSAIVVVPQAFPTRLQLYSMYSLKPWTVEGRCKSRKVMMSFRLTFTTLPLTLLDPCPMVCQLSQHPVRNSLSATIWAQDKVVFAFSQINFQIITRPNCQKLLDPPLMLVVNENDPYSSLMTCRERFKNLVITSQSQSTFCQKQPACELGLK